MQKNSPNTNNSRFFLHKALSLESKLCREPDILNSYCLYASPRETAAHWHQVIIRTCKLVCSDKRTCLMAENVEGLVFLKANLNNF